MDYPSIIASIRRGECLLVVGPELGQATNIPPLHTAFRDHSPKLHAREVLIYDRYGLMTFSDDSYEFDYTESWVSFCESQPIADVYRQIAQIPFPLVISLSTDGLLESAFEQQHGANAKLLPIGLARLNSTVKERLTKEQPTVLSLLGNIRKSQHIVLTHSQILDFLFNILENGREKALPEAVQEAISDSKRIIFIGCKLNAWYMQVMMRLLGLGAKENRRRLSASEHIELSDSDKAFFRSEFRMEFEEDAPHDLVQELWKAFNDESAMSNEHPAKVAVNAHIARGELREALKALIEHFREDTDTMNGITLLRGRLSTLQEDIADGVISAENASIERAKLARSIQSIAQTIE